MARIRAMIAVRSGSERVPNKNIRPFAGLNLLEIKIRQLMTIFDAKDVIINSDSEEMLNIAREYGCTDTLRRAGMAASSASMSDVYVSMAEDADCDVICYCNVTSPLISMRAILMCMGVFEELEEGSVATVTDVKDFLINGDSKLPINYSSYKQPRSQDLPNIKRLTWGCSVISRADMIRHKNVIVPGCLTMVDVDQVEALDIDTEYDFLIAETVYELLKSV